MHILSYFSGHALQYHVIQTLQLHYKIECTIACLDHWSCKSYNFQENKDNLRTCELSDSTKSMSTSDFVSRPGYSYYDTGDMPAVRLKINSIAQ